MPQTSRIYGMMPNTDVEYRAPWGSADKELNDAYQKLLSKLNADSKKLLKTGQLAWIEARNTQCTARRAKDILVNLDCATRTTVERAQFLNDRHRECVSAGCMPSKLRQGKRRALHGASAT